MTKPAEVIDLDRSAAIREELAELRARREALESVRRARDEAEAGAKKIAAEKFAIAKLEAIEEAEAKHGPLDQKIAVIDTDLGAVIVKRAHAATFRKYQDRGKSDHDTISNLVRPSLVYPALADFERICDELPATMARCADAIVGLAGFRVQELSGKS